MPWRLPSSLGAALLLAAGCSDGVPVREATIVNVLVRADLPLLRGRRGLVAGKYGQMAANEYSFFRGSFALYLHDAGDSQMPIGPSDFKIDGAFPLGIGDAHPENFGILIAPDASFAIEPNDLDGADRYPYLWELRRLCTGMVIASRLSNAEMPDAQAAAVAGERDAARAVARRYAEVMMALADGAEAERQVDAGGSRIAADLFDRATGDFEDREELDELTDLSDGVRTLKRGGIDPDVPENVYLDLPGFVREALPDMFAAYRETLIAPPPPEYFTVLDAVRERGSGIASWPRVRLVALVRGPSDAPDDDVILEVKELADSGARGWSTPGVSFDSVAQRVLGAARQLWSRPDAEPLWGTSALFGFPVQIKQEAEALKTIRTNRFTGTLGTAEEIAALGAMLGGLVARMHAASGEPLRSAVSAAIGDDVDGFAAEQADAAVRYADQIDEDWAHFQRALDRLGPTLGVRNDASDEPSPELRALYADPPLEVSP